MARAAAAHAQVIALTQAGEDLSLPEEVDLAFCRFLLLHVLEPIAVVRMMAARRPPRRLGRGPRAHHLGRADRRVARSPCPMPAIPTSARCSRRWCATPGSRSSTPGPRRPPASGPGRSARYLESLTGVDPGDDPVVLPPLVTVIGRRA